MGTQLQINGNAFRFAGANMHWLPMGDSTLYTSQFQINDALNAAHEMGLTVVRSHDLGISTGCPNCIEPTLGTFNATALQHDDYVIAAAQAHGIRLIIPLVDNYHYPAGGKHNFTDWRGISDENQFYTNPQVISDFEQYISVILNRVNTYTGIAYKNDPTIMAWETGNELHPPSAWTDKISTFIKGLDKNHLVIDGSSNIDPSAANMSNVDIVSDHYYPKNITRLTSDAALATNMGKAFIVGEYDWNDANGGDTLNSFLAAIKTNPIISGDAFWELWPHDDQYGYVSAEVQYMLHYPGDSQAMITATQQIRTHAYQMNNLAVPPASLPTAPVINASIKDDANNLLTWQGSAIAAKYTIERSTTSAKGPWTVICNQCVTDNMSPWTDTTPPNGIYWYRMTPYNLAGQAGSPSASFQGVSVANPTKWLKDDLNNWDLSYAHSSNLYFDTTNISYMNNDPSRASRSTPDHLWIIWNQPNIGAIQVTSYFWPYEDVSHFSFYLSADGTNW
ncbi:MAG TPA: glycoside hydrolase family 2 TIM barrel-domain containing protein, partial [Ktedonobacteraceae bacterium]|nr:glycoside hydrolase family 2 TIM barrel-domain containing protein [Ktedonobacteraceae bacterium]